MAEDGEVVGEVVDGIAAVVVDMTKTRPDILMVKVGQLHTYISRYKHDKRETADS